MNFSMRVPFTSRKVLKIVYVCVCVCWRREWYILSKNWSECSNSYMTFCPSCKRQGCTKKYDELILVNHVQTNEILLIENFTYKVFKQKSLVEYMYIYTYIHAFNWNHFEMILPRPRIGMLSLVTVSPVITAFHSCCLSQYVFLISNYW